MIRFILNNELVQTDLPEGSPLVDFIRYEAALPGTKIGCREGDCGACTVLQGHYEDGIINYKSIVSCLTPLGNAHGTHIVTLEGLKMEKLTPVQQAMVDNAATQCGFCTPGFIMSFTEYSMSHKAPQMPAAIASVSGNVCRCTGYKSIERAAENINNTLEKKDLDSPIGWLVQNKHLPDYFLQISERLSQIEAVADEAQEHVIMGGGTDLMVQKHDEIAESSLRKFHFRKELKQISQKDGAVTIGSACTAEDIATHPIMVELFPKISDFFRLISSKPIRNTGTIAGNIINASPIGDLSIFFLALNANLTINRDGTRRKVALNKFFLDYKKTDIRHDEYIEYIHFDVPQSGFLFNYEKVSKRTHLDIASVTSAICIEMNGDTITKCGFSAGGVKAIPLFLEKTAAFLQGKKLSKTILHEANEVLQQEIAPIGDVRGSEQYKRLLLRQLMFAHFVELFPGKIDGEKLL